MLNAARSWEGPVLRVSVPEAPPPHEAHRRLAAEYPSTFILESRDGPDRLARYSFVGWDPAGTLQRDRLGWTVRGSVPTPHRGEPTIGYLRRVLADARRDAPAADAGPFAGGLVGVIGFAFVADLEPSLRPALAARGEAGRPGLGGAARLHPQTRQPPPNPAQDSEWPSVLLGLYLDCLVYDHLEGTCTYVSRGDDRSAQLEILKRPMARRRLQVGHLASSTSRSGFEAKVREAQQLIAAGECFQVVLSRSYSAVFAGDLGECYDRLREALRVPYLYHLRFAGQPARAILGASPEMLVRVRGRTAETVPIAGTRPFTGEARRDSEQARALLGDAKERAEHFMLVDLARNDLARACQAGTVAVPELAAVAPFGPVQHIVSRVTGTLSPGKDALDALAAVFPAGTVSGAPKLRAIEHLVRLEATERGPYAGCVLYASLEGELDSAIAIRSLSATIPGDAGEGRFTVQAGAGIVAGSQPRLEFEETQRKAATMLAALKEFGAEMPNEELMEEAA
jgi:anthranilate synthase component 1